MIFEITAIFFLTAFFGALISTSPPGPLNMRLVLLFLKKQKGPLFAFQTGIIATDYTCCLFAFLLAEKTIEAEYFLNLHKKNLLLFEFIFIFIILLFGISFIIRAKKKLNYNKSSLNFTKLEKVSNIKLISHFLEGIVGTLTIPTLLPFWYLWWMGQNYNNKPPIFLLVISIALGVYFGDLLIFKTYRFFAGRLHEKFYKIKINKIELWAGYLLIFIASILFIKIFFS